MKVNVKLFSDIVSKMALSGAAEIIQTIMNFEDTVITSAMRNELNNVAVRMKISAKIFQDYSAMGELGILNLALLKSVVKRHTDVIDVVVNKNKITISDKTKKSDLLIPELEFLKKKSGSFPDVSKAEWDEIITLPASEIKAFTSELGMIKAKALTIKTGKGVLILSAGKMDSIQTKIAVETKAEMSVQFYENFIDTINTFNDDDELKLHLKSDHPCYIQVKTKYFLFEYVITPSKN